MNNLIPVDSEGVICFKGNETDPTGAEVQHGDVYADAESGDSDTTVGEVSTLHAATHRRCDETGGNMTASGSMDGVLKEVATAMQSIQRSLDRRQEDEIRRCGGNTNDNHAHGKPTGAAPYPHGRDVSQHYEGDQYGVRYPETLQNWQTRGPSVSDRRQPPHDNRPQHQHTSSADLPHIARQYQDGAIHRNNSGGAYRRPMPHAQHANVKIPSFNGTEDWSMWIARFEAIADRYWWSDEDKLDQLIPRLEGIAAEFVFSQLPRDVIYDYHQLTGEITSRFRVVETAQSFAAKFSRRTQRHGETAEDYAADLKRLYDRAHGYRDRRTRDEDLVRRFLDGLCDEEIRVDVEYHKEPKNIDEAVYHVVNLLQIRNSCRTRAATTFVGPMSSKVQSAITLTVMITTVRQSTHTP